FVGFPQMAIKECMMIAGIESEDIDNIAYGTNELLTAIHTNIFKRGYLPKNILKDKKDLMRANVFERYRNALTKKSELMKADLYFSKKLTEKSLRRMGFAGREMYFVDHHLAHAESARFIAPRSKSIIITIDGQGNGLSGTVSVLKGGEIERLSEIYVYSSLGHFYGGITEVLGYKSAYDECKVMALAPFGDHSKCYDTLIRYFYVDRLKIVKRDPMRKYGRCVSLFLRELLSENEKKDIAAGAQKVLEDIVYELVSNSIEETGIKNLLLSGGVFLNVKLNKTISEMDEVKDVRIFPAAGDAGIPIGAALLVNRNLSNIRTNEFSSPYMGGSWKDEEILETLKKSNYRIKWEYSDNIEGRSAEMLAKGMMGGWFQGRMEMGPRALGNRTVIADPRDVNSPTRLNTTIKRRPAFQPFCQSMLKENEKYYLINPKGIDGSYMIMAFESTERGLKETPAVVHIDNSIRPQLLNRNQNQKFYELLKEFYKITGVPVVLNTSLNRSHEPIVNRPDEAIYDLVHGKLDFLAMGNYLIKLNHS
ncbi:MAG: hypothetical protein JSW41_01620, partial [Candidatus Aenigmatarchaeota archaeon]